MMLNEVAARVVEVLTRAESLFAVPEDAAAASTAADQLGQAADAHRALGGHNAELSGAGATGHRQLVDESAAGVGAAARADEQLAAHLTAAAARHHHGRARMQELRSEAAAVLERFATLSGTGTSELAALKALRAQVAAVQQLLAEHAGQSAAAAAQIRAVDYRP
jgi:uncharacterized protein involved in exopolysaccharide biosynthesis